MRDESWGRFVLRFSLLIAGLLAITLIGVIATEGWTESWAFFIDLFGASEGE